MRYLLTLLCSCAAVICVTATPTFNNGTHYKIVCRQFPDGCVTDGALALQPTPLYYRQTATEEDFDRWIINEEVQGLYSIKNAVTGEYVTYDGVRDTYRRYVSMTGEIQGKNSLWTINSQGSGYFNIRNAQQTDHIWDVRVDSYMVGTYSNNGGGNQNQLFAFYDDNGNMMKEPVVVANPLGEAIKESITFDGFNIVYTSSLGLYLCTIPLNKFGNDYTVTVEYTPKEGYGTLIINGTPVESGQQYTFSQVEANKNYILSITASDGKTIVTHMTFTSLPVVKMYGTFSNTYSEGNIIVSEANGLKPEMLNMKAKWRGGITNGNDKHKRNYHVKLIDSNGQKTDRSFFGLRSDNSWILESCQVDMSRIRNRVFTDMWNDYATPPYYADAEPKARTGTRGKFVELILNEEYRGIYCMTEFIDRKQMKLLKYDEETQTQHGQLWKSKDWSYAVFMGHNPNSTSYPGTSPTNFNQWSEAWDQYYVKYPDYDDVSPTNWQTLYDAVNFVCTATVLDFRNHIAEYFDIPLLTDYYILMETILSTDNHGKNMFFAVYDKQTDKRITFAVWDMDATAGQRWSDAYYHWNGMRPEQDYTQYIINNEHGDYNLFRRMKSANPDNFNMNVRLRYRDLRQNHLNTESILNRFRTYLNEFKTSGAAQREYNKWNGDTDINRLSLNFDTEMEYIEDWITRRMNYLDNTRFKIAELPLLGIETIYNDEFEDATADECYDLLGRKVSNPQNGIYICGGKKTFIKR